METIQTLPLLQAAGISTVLSPFPPFFLVALLPWKWVFIAAKKKIVPDQSCYHCCIHANFPDGSFQGGKKFRTFVSIRPSTLFANVALRKEEKKALEGSPVTFCLREAFFYPSSKKATPPCCNLASDVSCSSTQFAFTKKRSTVAKQIMAAEESLEKAKNVEEPRKKFPQKVKELKAPYFPIQTLFFQGRVISLDFQSFRVSGPFGKRKGPHLAGGEDKKSCQSTIFGCKRHDAVWNINMDMNIVLSLHNAHAAFSF